MKYSLLILLILLILITDVASGAVSVTGGWAVSGEGSGSTEGLSVVSNCGTDPSIQMGITSTSSAFGIGNHQDERSGNLSISLPLGGYVLSAGFDGNVNSNLTLESLGTGSVSSYVGATATAISTGHSKAGKDSYDLFGSADIKTNGYLVGKGNGSANAKGSSNYGVTKIGTPSEVVGQVLGASSLVLEGKSSESYASTSGMDNGLHTESRFTQNITEQMTSSSYSSISAYASVANNAYADVAVYGNGSSGVWSADSTVTKAIGVNENVASNVSAEIEGFANSNGHYDAADISAIVQSRATQDPRLYVSGGPASYAAVTQTSDSKETSSHVLVKNSTWNSVSRTENNQSAMISGDLTNLTSDVWVNESGASAIAFGKILMYADYQTVGDKAYITGNFTLDTYSEATKNLSAFASNSLGVNGNGTLSSRDGSISGTAGFVGPLSHFSIYNSTSGARAANKVTEAFVITNPIGYETISQPIRADTKSDPVVVWARTDGAYILAGA